MARRAGILALVWLFVVPLFPVPLGKMRLQTKRAPLRGLAAQPTDQIEIIEIAGERFRPIDVGFGLKSSCLSSSKVLYFDGSDCNHYLPDSGNIYYHYIVKHEEEDTPFGGCGKTQIEAKLTCELAVRRWLDAKVSAKEIQINEVETQIQRLRVFASAVAVGELEGGIRARRLESAKANDDAGTTIVSSWITRKAMHEKWIQQKNKDHRGRLAKLEVQIKRLIVTLGEEYANTCLLTSDSDCDDCS